MTKSENELSKLKTSAIRKKQTLDVIRLRIPYGDMSVYQRMQTEIFLKNIRIMAETLSQIESYNDILAARDLIQDLGASPHNDGKQVIEFILKMLNEMMNAIVFQHQVKFRSIKENLIMMLDDNMKDILAS